MKIVLCATHPWNTNGYSLVMTNFARCLCGMDDVEKIWYFGFQNALGEDSRNKRPMPDKVELYDAFANENPKKQGFGDDLICAYVVERKPDVVVIFNDSIVVERITGKLMEIPEKGFKIVVYQDLVYEHVRERFVEQLNARADRVLAFTPYWKQHMEDQGVKTPIDVVRHAFDPTTKFPVDRVLARRYFGIGTGDFIILNLNRNQPRKRWDICLKAYAEFLSRHRGEPVKLLIGTSTQGCWDLMSIYRRELQKRDMTFEEGRKHLIVLDAPQKLSDDDVNVLMNCADIGISASDGEGFGLCNFEHAALGYPQVVSNVGGHRDFFAADRAFLCDPVMGYYVDRTRDGVGGEGQLIDYRDMVDGIEFYYKDAAAREKHGRASRKHILDNYRWDEQAAAFAASLRETLGIGGSSVDAESASVDASSGPERADSALVSSGPERADSALVSSGPEGADSALVSSGPERADSALVSSGPEGADSALVSSGPEAEAAVEASAAAPDGTPRESMEDVRRQLAILTAMVERLTSRAEVPC
jgi:glycosyltransferase involved in cell wall biosynthesis